MRRPGRTRDLGAALLVVALLPGVAASGNASASADAGGATVAFRLQDPAITESSGLVHTGDHVLTVNDSGDGPVVYVIDPATGRTVGRTTYSTDPVVDVEALALGVDGDLWVGDIGDNPGTRAFISLYRLPVPTPGDRTVTAERFDLVYRGGPRDAEALLVHPRTGRVHVVSKSLLNGRVYAAPPVLRPGQPSVLEPVGRADAVVTDGVALPDGRHALLRSYAALWLVETEGWTRLGTMRLPSQEQGEGLALPPGDDAVLVSTEGEGSPVHRVPLPATLRPPAATQESPTPSASPSADAAGTPSPTADAEAGEPTSDHASTPGRTGLVLGALAAAAAAVGFAALGWRRRRQSRSTT